MSNPTELPDLAEAVRKLVKAKGRFHTEQNYKELADALARYDARRAQPEGEAPQAESFQQRVQPWMTACFGPRISADTTERNHRFIEEALELVQAGGMPKSEVLQLVDYTYGRPVGEQSQEVGGVMVTLAALCLAQGLDMHDAAEVELARIWTKVEAIRAKQLTKPRGSPLPAPAASLSPLCGAQHAESGKEGVAIAAFKKWHQEVGDQDCEYTWLQAWTAAQLSPDLKKRMADALNVTLWLYRRLPGAYGRPPFVDAALLEMAKIANIDAQGAIAERAAQLDGGQEGSESNG